MVTNTLSSLWSQFEEEEAYRSQPDWVTSAPDPVTQFYEGMSPLWEQFEAEQAYQAQPDVGQGVFGAMPNSPAALSGAPVMLPEIQGQTFTTDYGVSGLTPMQSLPGYDDWLTKSSALLSPEWQTLQEQELNETAGWWDEFLRSQQQANLSAAYDLPSANAEWEAAPQWAREAAMQSMAAPDLGGGLARSWINQPIGFLQDFAASLGEGLQNVYNVHNLGAAVPGAHGGQVGADPNITALMAEAAVPQRPWEIGLEFVPGIGFVPDALRAARGLRALTAAEALPALPAVRRAITEVPQFSPEARALRDLAGQTVTPPGPATLPFGRQAMGAADELQWAKGAAATDLLARGTQAVSAPKLTAANRREVIRILRAHPEDVEGQQLLWELSDRRYGTPRASETTAPRELPNFDDMPSIQERAAQQYGPDRRYTVMQSADGQRYAIEFDNRTEQFLRATRLADDQARQGPASIRQAVEADPDAANLAQRLEVIEQPNAPTFVREATPPGALPDGGTSSPSRQAAPPDSGGVPPIEPPVETPTPPAGPTPPSSTPATTQLLGLHVPEPHLRPLDRALNAAKRAMGFGIEAEETVTPIMRERARATRVGEAQASRMGAIAEDIAQQHFVRDDFGRILSLPYAPTIQDVAAKLPRYADLLTPEQLQALENMRDQLAPYRQALEEVGIDVRHRADVIEGGFYLPRGNAAVEGADEPLRYRGGRSGGRRGFEKAAEFETQWQGIDAGYEYSSFGAAIENYVRDATARIADQYTANALVALTDDAGNLLAQTAADRINPALREQVQSLRAKITGRLQTVARQTARTEAQRNDESRVMNLLKRVEANIDTKAGSLDQMSPTEAAFKRAEAELRVLDRMANRIGGTAQDIGESALRGEYRRSETMQAIRDLRNQLDNLRGDWERAKQVANQTPRGQGRTQMPGLQAYSFPDAMAEAINKELRVGQVGWAPAEVTKAVNTVLRMLSATLDVSFNGIQLLLAAVDKPGAYAKAVGMAMKSLADPNVAGAFIRSFDEKAARMGLPTSEDWARNGLRISGMDTEFTGGRGVGRIGAAIQNAPGIKQANRAFATAGDTARLLMAQDEFVMRKLAAGEGLDSSMTQIATAINRSTGVGKGRFLGDLGEVIQFAPRYFNSQLEMIARAATPNKPGSPMSIENQIARRQLIKLIGVGVALTAGVNYMLGNKHDYYTPVINGRLNPNFMRIRFAGQDASLFAGWDSLLRAVVAGAGGDFGYLARSKASPVVSHAWDLIAGENFIGDPVNLTSPEGIENFARSFLPFSTQQIGQEPPVSVGLNLAGIKSTPLSMSDKQFEQAQDLFSSDFDSLQPRDKAAVNAALVEKGETLERWRRAAPYNDAREVAFEQLGLPYMTEEAFRADIARRVIEKGGDQDLADEIASELLKEISDRAKKIRFEVVGADPDIIEFIANPSKEIREWAAEVKTMRGE